MKYRLNVFSPETYTGFSATDKTTAGVTRRFRNLAAGVEIGDLLICYITKLSRWCGLFEVDSQAYEDETPRFFNTEDPYTVRFRVKPIVWLPPEHSIPIHDEVLWNALSFTRDCERGSSTWTGILRTGFTEIQKEDGELIEALLRKQMSDPVTYPLDQREQKLLGGYRVKRADGDVSVTVPDDDEAPLVQDGFKKEVRESIKIQALLADIGDKMGMQIWLPASDRSAVTKELDQELSNLLDSLPLNYDSTTIETIERIDVLWIKGRSIFRAFEVEHTTSIYSGILRMADLLSLQPNMDIRLHIVAPEERRNKVMTEICRPVFSLIERQPLVKSCTFLSYDSIREIAALPHLQHLSDSIIEEYEEFADE